MDTRDGFAKKKKKKKKKKRKKERIKKRLSEGCRKHRSGRSFKYVQQMNKNVFHPNSITLSFSCFFVFQIPCTPNSPNFQCMGLGMFANVPSVGPWCVEKCKKNACVDSVCQCSCPSQALGIDDTILFIYFFFY